ncbi:hypothetical protein G6F63_013403 [Rhizopus arrhizus]|nr:hypothetical protein G6F63_013403 [Rhizopus arrhizus]
MLLIGAGGSARSVAPALLDAGITELVVVNRTPERADELIDAMGEPGRAISRYWEDLRDLGDFELIVNATSAGRDRNVEFKLPLSLVNSMTTAVDLNYGEAAIAFLAWARAANCRNTVDGLGMLVEQAAESFLQWHGVRPQTDEHRLAGARTEHGRRTPAGADRTVRGPGLGGRRAARCHPYRRAGRPAAVAAVLPGRPGRRHPADVAGQQWQLWCRVGHGRRARRAALRAGVGRGHRRGAAGMGAGAPAAAARQPGAVTPR